LPSPSEQDLMFIDLLVEDPGEVGKHLLQAEPRRCGGAAAEPDDNEDEGDEENGDDEDDDREPAVIREPDEDLVTPDTPTPDPSRANISAGLA